MSKIARYSKKTVVILNTNSAILMPWLDEVDAVLEFWYGGQQIGLALERLLFGDVSPGGKLPLTFPKTLSDTIQISSSLDVPYDEGLYVGYKWYDAHTVEPMFPFGHRLSYSSFERGDLTVELKSTQGVGHVACMADLTNTGNVMAIEVVQLTLQQLWSHRSCSKHS